MNALELIAHDLFEKVRSRFSNLQMGDENGNVTIIPEDARFFDFNFTMEETKLGRVSISINDVGNLKIFYSQGITETSDPDTLHAWYDFLREMRFFAKRRLLRFDTRDITKGNLDKTDFQYLAQNKPKDGNMNESAMYGTLKTSHRTLEDTDLIIRHSEAIDPSKPGARSRKIKNLFIQNKEGERFKFPFIYLPGARAMQRHVANGGYPHDDAGKKIMQTCEEILKLSDFGRKVRSATLNDSANEIIERATSKLQNLRKHMECMSKQKYYESWMETQADSSPSLIELDDATFESYKSAFTVNKFDEALADVFPILHAIMQETNELDLDDYVGESQGNDDEDEESMEIEGVQELNAFEEWANDITNEMFNDDELRALENLVKEPLLIGANNEAIQALMGIGIKDQELLNAIKVLGDMPNGAEVDAREIIKAYMGPDAGKINWEDGETQAPELPEVPSDAEPSSEPSEEEPAPQPAAEGDCGCDDEKDGDKLIEPESGKNAMKEVAKIVSGFYNREDGTWTKGEHGVVTHVKRKFAGEDGKGGEKEAALAAKLINHLNQKSASEMQIAEMKRLAGLKK